MSEFEIFSFDEYDLFFEKNRAPSRDLLSFFLYQILNHFSVETFIFDSYAFYRKNMYFTNGNHDKTDFLKNVDALTSYSLLKLFLEKLIISPQNFHFW